MNEDSTQIASLIDRSNIQSELQYTYITVNIIVTELEYILSEIRHHIDDLVLASKGIVTSNIISLDELT